MSTLECSVWTLNKNYKGIIISAAAEINISFSMLLGNVFIRKLYFKQITFMEK